MTNKIIIYSLLLFAIIPISCKSTPNDADKTQASTSSIIYQPQDSVMVEKLLNEGLQQPQGTNLMLFFGRKFIGTPYVGHTLEVPYNKKSQDATEQLVINLRQLDCTTFVETVCALTRTTLQGKSTFADYCANLQLFRYQNGQIIDYTSRNHYFTTWIDNAETLGIAQQIGPNESASFCHRKQTINYMTLHHSAYAALCCPGASKYYGAITAAEQAICRQVYYLPKSELGKNSEQLSFIHDGDILALETTKEGLDVSHLGIACWGKDGKLHLLNASSLKKFNKVVLDPTPLQTYQNERPSQLGIRIIRITNP